MLLIVLMMVGVAIGLAAKGNVKPLVGVTIIGWCSSSFPSPEADHPMRIAVLKEDPAVEPRVAATPETVKKFAAAGASVAVEAGAGAAAGLADERFAKPAPRSRRAPRRLRATPIWS